MPTYEYACRDCGNHIEVVQSFADDALTECASCHGELRKVFGNIGISFKGAGFYKTDNRASTKKAKPESTEKTNTADSSKTSSSKESTGSSEKGTKPISPKAAPKDSAGGATSAAS